MTEPTTPTAKVTTFSGEVVTLTVERVWFWEGTPERVWGTDEHGVAYKFKQDEEPFTLHGPFCIEAHHPMPKVDLTCPTTPTGQRLGRAISGNNPAADLRVITTTADIIAIEQEAAAAERERLLDLVPEDQHDIWIPVKTDGLDVGRSVTLARFLSEKEASTDD